jgi:spore coat polysaccharide biosynthesis protein SpsF
MIGAIIQARSGSKRFPNKMFKKILGQPILWHVIQRVRASTLIDQIIVATTRSQADDKIVSLAKKMGLNYYRGSTNDVLGRFYQAAKKFKTKIIVRITPDDIFEDPSLIDSLLKIFIAAKGKYDYISNTVNQTHPEGIDVEVFSFAALQRAFREAKKLSEREHVTPYLWNNPNKFRIKSIKYHKDLSHLRWTIDYPKDLEFARKIYQRLYFKKRIFLMNDVLKVLKKHPAWQKINQGVIFHEGYLKSLKNEK